MKERLILDNNSVLDSLDMIKHLLEEVAECFTWAGGIVGTSFWVLTGDQFLPLIRIMLSAG